jgi:hypothetical protein
MVGLQPQQRVQPDEPLKAQHETSRASANVTAMGKAAEWHG